MSGAGTIVTTAVAGCLDDLEATGAAGASDEDPDGDATDDPAGHETPSYDLELVDESLVDDETSADLSVELVEPSIAPPRRRRSKRPPLTRQMR